MEKGIIEMGQKHQQTGYATISVDELLLFFYGLKSSDSIDSRILFHFMQSRIVECEIRHQHSDWVTFACEAADLDLLPFCCVDVRSASNDDEFLMFTPRQACFLILYAKYPEKTFMLSLKPTFDTFLQENKDRKFSDAWLAALYLCDKINKTAEKLREEKQEPTRKQIEKDIEVAFSERLKQQDIEVRRQVRCPSGIADIVTPNAIYEVKAELTHRELRHAIAQVLSYRVYINPTAKVYVIGCKPKKEEIMYDLTEALGVEIIIWDEGQVSN